MSTTSVDEWGKAPPSLWEDMVPSVDRVVAVAIGAAITSLVVVLLAVSDAADRRNVGLSPAAR